MRISCRLLAGSVALVALGGALTACESSSSSGSLGAGWSSEDASSPGVDGAADAGPEDSTASGSDDGSTSDAATDSPGTSPPDASSTVTGDGGLPDAYGPVPDGGVFVQFVQGDRATYFDTSQEQTPTGTVTFGVFSAGASDGNVAKLTRTGGTTPIGTTGAEEIVSNRSFSYGTFRIRTTLASCASNEELVNGLFTYFNDGSTAPDGLVINREVDIEVLCGEPWLINLTIWTEFNDDTHCKNQSRVVDMKAGKVYAYANDQSSGVLTGTEDHPELLIPGWPQPGTFYELGWTWAPDHLRYFMNVGGADVTLWDATDATRIPQAEMAQHFNLWAPGIHWSTGANAGPPAKDSSLTLDWWRYDPL
jgi:hypothetical protein